MENRERGCEGDMGVERGGVSGEEGRGDWCGVERRRRKRERRVRGGYCLLSSRWDSIKVGNYMV